VALVARAREGRATNQPEPARQDTGVTPPPRSLREPATPSPHNRFHPRHHGTDRQSVGLRSVVVIGGVARDRSHQQWAIAPVTRRTTSLPDRPMFSPPGRPARRPDRSSPGRSPSPPARRRRPARPIPRSPAWPWNRRQRPTTSRCPRSRRPRRRSRLRPGGSPARVATRRTRHNAPGRAPARPWRSAHHTANRTRPHRQCESRSADTRMALPPPNAECGRTIVHLPLMVLSRREESLRVASMLLPALSSEQCRPLSP